MWWIKFFEIAGLVSGPFGLGSLVVAATLAINLRSKEKALVDELDSPMIKSVDQFAPILKTLDSADRVTALAKLLDVGREHASRVWENINRKVDVNQYLKRRSTLRHTRMLGSFAVLLGVLFYGGAVAGKKVIVQNIETERQSLVTVFRDSEQSIKAALGATMGQLKGSVPSSETPISIMLLSGIVVEERELMRAFTNGDGGPWILDGPRTFESVMASRSAYFDRLREVYPREREFWGRLVDAAARVAHMSLQLEELSAMNSNFHKQSAELKDKASSIIDTVTLMRAFADRNELTQREVAEGLIKVHMSEGGRYDETQNYTAAMSLRQKLGGIANRDIPEVVLLLEALDLRI